MSGTPRAIGRPTPEDLFSVMAEHVLPKLRAALETAMPGQRLRVAALPTRVMEICCEQLYPERRWVARVLRQPSETRQRWDASSSSIIELRNTLTEPLLVFLPPGVRTAAEDSLDIATFTELTLSDLTSELSESLLGRLSEDLQQKIGDGLDYLRLQRVVRNRDQEVEFALTIWKNGRDAWAAGGALSCLGLVPDFEAFSGGGVRRRLSRNVEACEKLGDLSQPLQTRIGRLTLEPNSIQKDLFLFLRGRHAQDVLEWAADIASNPDLHGIAFNRWPFLDAEDEKELRIILEPLALPTQPADLVGGATQMPVLELSGKKKDLRISFHSIPHHTLVSGWRSFRVQILAIEGNEPTIAWESNNFPRPTGRPSTVKRTIKLKSLKDLEEGTYFLRIEAFGSSGAVLTSPHRSDPDDPRSRAENESEPFLVTRESGQVEPAQSRAVEVGSLADAWTLASARALSSEEENGLPQLAAVQGAWRESSAKGTRGNAHFPLIGEGLHGYTVVVPSILRRVELAILEQPQQLGPLRLDFRKVRSSADVEPKRLPRELMGPTSLVGQFLDARARAFHDIREQHAVRYESDPATGKLLDDLLDLYSGVRPDLGRDEIRDRLRGLLRDHRLSLVETADLMSLEASVTRYCQAYVDLADALLSNASSETARADLRILAGLDAVELRWHPSPHDPGRALLLGPTHPARLLWHLQHVRVRYTALVAWRDLAQRARDWRGLLEQDLSGLVPMCLPLVMFDTQARDYVEHGPLTGHWSLYLADWGSDRLDAASCREAARRLLGVSGRIARDRELGSDEIASRVFEYLAQHPYVDQLKINVFNPGDGQLIADALCEIEKRRLTSVGSTKEPPALRYAVQMFSGGAHIDEMGEALDRLLDPERQVSEDDEFTATSTNHLLPKLVFARNSADEFLAQPHLFEAHLSVLLEQFRVTGRLGDTERMARGSFVHGLVLEPDIVADGPECAYGWAKGLRAIASDRAPAVDRLLTRVAGITQRVQAAAAAGEPQREGIAPVAALQLGTEGQSLLKEIHGASHWVLTIDRNLGLEFFDSPSSARDTGYLLDYAPEYLQENRQRILLTTRSTVELEKVVFPALERFGLEPQSGDGPVVLEGLRSMSGRLAFRLLSLSTQSAESVGLLLARWLLEDAGVLDRCFVVPLDAHRNWFGPIAAEDEDDVSCRRADLLLVSVNGARRELRFLIVEVKLREELSPAARVELYGRMQEQADNTEERLRDAFDPAGYAVPRADLALRAKELATALSFYLRRSRRYRLLTEEEADEARALVQSLDEGYRIVTHSMGVVFELRGEGSHLDEEGGFKVHRFGLDVAKRLLARARSRFGAQVGVSGRGEPEDQATTTARDRDLDSLRDTVTTRAGLRDARAAKARLEAVGLTGEMDVPAPPPSRVGPPAPAEEYPRRPEHDGSASSPVAEPQRAGGVAPDVLVGANEMTPQLGILGRGSQGTVAVDLTGCNTISLFGVQGFGKSYTLGVVAEMVTTAVPGINCLPSPLASVIFHYHKSDAYPPEYASALLPNQKPREVERLRSEYGAEPKGLDDVVLLTPEGKVDARRQEFPGITVLPIKFASSELGADSWKFLLGAYGNESLYVRQLVAIMRRHRQALTLETFRNEINQANLPPASLRLAIDRLALAEPYIDDTMCLASVLHPARTVIVDLRDEWIEKDEALGLFVVMLRIFAGSRFNGQQFNKLVVFDEAHKYITESELIGQVVETIREMRHQATSIVIASQDPLSVPRAIIELTSLLVLHRMTSPQWLKHLKSAISALDDVSEAQLGALGPGEALLWAQRATDRRFTQRPQKLHIRPRFTQHGGGTKTAVAGATVR